MLRKLLGEKREGLTEDLEDLDDVEKVDGEKREGLWDDLGDLDDLG